MGCASTVPTTPSSVGLVGDSAKQWLGLEAAPASFKIMRRADGGKGITVEVAGMDSYGFYGKIENAFTHRGFEMDSSMWAVRGALFHATFHLSFETKSNAPGAVWELTCEHAEREFSPCKFYAPIPEKDEKEEPVHLKFSFVHNMGGELRMGFLRLVNATGGHTCFGQATSMSVCDAEGRKQRDVFHCDLPRGNVELLLKEELVSAPAFQQHLAKARRQLEQVSEAGFSEPLNSPTFESRFNRQVSPTKESGFDRQVTPAADAAEMKDFINSLVHADIRAMQKSLQELPVAVRTQAKGADYKIKPSSWGAMLPGYKKYMGAGIVKESAGEKASKTPAVQFTTLIVQDCENKKSWSSDKLRQLSLIALMAPQYAEFVNTIDVDKSRFIIEKVFLHDVCPRGQNIGSRMTAEQLWAPVWENGASGMGELLPVDKIKEIKISDVVNWNTYCVMSVAMGIDFGAHFKSSMIEELKAANLTLAQCTEKLDLRDVFLNTILGKFVNRVFDSWHSWTGVRLRACAVEVCFRQEYEIIAGEARQAMDIFVKVVK